jgi:DNA-binding NarL/FixJ family response regulator
MPRAKVLVADDHALMIEAVLAALSDHDDLQVVATTTDATKIQGLVRRLRPDVALVDVLMPRLDGITVLKRILAEFPDTVVVMFSASEDPQVIETAFRLGARAFVLKHIDPADLAAAIRQAIKGTVFNSTKSFAEAAAEAAQEAGLSRKQQEVLNLVAAGLSNSAIARELWLSTHTVKFHLTHIYRLLGVHSRTEAINEARRRGLLAPALSIVA